MSKAIFLDRDGVINQEVQFVAKPEEFHILDNSIKALKLLMETDYKIIIITNQSGMGYGYYTEDDYQAVTNKMVKIFAEEGIVIDAIYHCPHRYEEKCNCRKPGTGMLDKAKKEFAIEYERSWFIGDKTSDIKAGENVGVKTIMVLTGAAGKDGRYDVKPDFIAADLLEAVYFITTLK